MRNRASARTFPRKLRTIDPAEQPASHHDTDPSAEDVFTRRLADRNHRRMLEPSFDRDCVEAVAERLDPPDHAHAMAPADLPFDDGRRGKDARSVLSERIHQLGVVKLADHRRVKAARRYP